MDPGQQTKEKNVEEINKLADDVNIFLKRLTFGFQVQVANH